MKALIKKAIQKTGWHLGRRNSYTAPFLDGEISSIFDHLLFRTFEGNLNGLRFVQIGANDGVHLDPLRHFIVKYQWRGVMVEPVREPFRSLEKLYAGNKAIALLQVAIDEAARSRTIYKISDADHRLPVFTSAISSFCREHLLSFSSLIPDIENYITEETVPCLPLADILRNPLLDRIDLLQIDTEGHDIVILNQLNLDETRPRLIQFEHAHVDSSQLVDCLIRLRKHGYGFVMEGRDLCAFQQTSA